jgi:hypothetical protein
MPIASFLRRAIFSCVACLVVHIFPHCLMDDTIFGKKDIQQETPVLIFCTTSVGNIFRSKKNSVICHKCTLGLHIKYPLFLLDFDDTSIFSTDFRNIFKHQISRKFVQWEPSFFPAYRETDRRMDGRTHITKLMAAFCNFANAPKSYKVQSNSVITSSKRPNKFCRCKRASL